MLALGDTSNEFHNGAPGRQPRSAEGTPTQPLDHSRSGRWLSIAAACEILGVDSSTLRRWSDRGRVPVFRTPGGHRRYSEEDLQAFLAGEVGEERPVSRRQLAALTQEEFRRTWPDAALAQYWSSICDEAPSDELRRICGRMLDLSVRYVSGRGNPDRLIQEARKLGVEYGEQTSGAMLSTTTAVDAFLKFRRPLLDGLRRYVEQENLPLRRSCRMMGRLNTFLDLVLTSIVDAHEVRTTW